jgi:hypothetical protein
MKYQFPTGSASTIVPSAGFILVWADNTPSQGALHTNFTLSAAGEYVGLYAPDGSLLDEVTFPALGPNESYGRQNEASSTWVLFGNGLSTPNASNATSKIEEVNTSLKAVFPNPANQFVTIQVTPVNETRSVYLFNTTGQVVFEGSMNALQSNLNITTAHLSEGTYLLRVGNNKSRSYHKLLVTH